jgi:hypothetical protein
MHATTRQGGAGCVTVEAVLSLNGVESVSQPQGVDASNDSRFTPLAAR